MSEKAESSREEGSKPRALIVDDDRESRSALAEWVESEGFEVAVAASVQEAKERLLQDTPDVVVVDLQLPDGSGIDLVRAVEDRDEIDIMMITGHGTIDSAVEALRGGAIDYLTKPVDLRRLKQVLTHTRKAWGLRGQVVDLRRRLRGLGRFGEMVGISPPIQRVYDLITRVAPTSSTVLVTGETGSGKELVARMVHDLSPRARGPFLPINCGAVSPSLIESELFGHEKGSFTGADRQHRGVFERSHHGTLFLDEITEMPMELQVRLLRILETRQVTRVGGDRALDADVRVVAATNRDPIQAVRDGKLREDLHYRLSVFPISIPPLRERGADDIRLLAEHFLVEMNRRNEGQTPKRFGAGALERLQDHNWPGNVRELFNLIERGYIMAGGVITADCIPLDGRQPDPAGAGDQVTVSVGTSIAESERRLVLATLEHTAGNKPEAAQILGISLKTLYSRLKEYGA